MSTCQTCYASVTPVRLHMAHANGNVRDLGDKLLDAAPTETGTVVLVDGQHIATWPHLIPADAERWTIHACPYRPPAPPLPPMPADARDITEPMHEAGQ